MAQCEALRNHGDGYPWEGRAELCDVQVGHQGDSEAIGEHQVGSYYIHYHSVRHGTANECKVGVTRTRTRTRAHTHTHTHTQTHRMRDKKTNKKELVYY